MTSKIFKKQVFPLRNLHFWIPHEILHEKKWIESYEHEFWKMAYISVYVLKMVALS